MSELKTTIGIFTFTFQPDPEDPAEGRMKISNPYDETIDDGDISCTKEEFLNFKHNAAHGHG